MAMLDRNTILSLNKDPKSIDLHKLALARMKNTHVDPSAKHEFIADRARTKGLGNMDDLYGKLNELEKNGVMDIWIKKFGKAKYGPGAPSEGKKLNESTTLDSFVFNKQEIVEAFHELEDSALEEMDGGAVGVGSAAGAGVPAGMTSGSSGPIATYGGTPGKNQINKNPETTLTHLGGRTHQDPGAK